MGLTDSQGRNFHYLRLSITDVCNFKCTYCLPNGYPAQSPESGLLKENPLSVSEIQNLIAGFAAMGFWKVRLTGGEPAVRRDLVDIAQAVAATPGIRKVAISTNGQRLNALSVPLVRAGVSAFNISVDSLDAERFQKITGMDRLPEILGGIDNLLGLSGVQVKLNGVLMRGLNDSDSDLEAVQQYIRNRPLSYRFIELMQTGENRGLFESRHVSAGELRFKLLRAGWMPEMREADSGPAVEFSHPDFLGKIGIIAPYSEGFCSNCNRLRVSSRGALRLCLFGTGEESLRPWLQSSDQRGQLIATVETLLGQKAPSHYLHEGNHGITKNLSAIGG